MSEKAISLNNLARYKQDSDNLYAKQDGVYEPMTVGSADNLTPYSEDSGAHDTKPFVFQSTGGSSDVGNKAYLKALRGNTIKWNQIAVLRASGTSYGVTITNNNDGSLTMSGTGNEHGYPTLISSDLPTIANHYYLIKGASASLPIFFAGSVYTTDFIHKVTTTANRNVQTEIISGTSYNETKWLQIFDLTEMFGAGNEPTSVEEFNRLFPKPYYEYNAGELLSCKVNGIKNVGYNAWDEEWELGTYNINTGEKSPSTTQIRCKNFIKVIPGQTYTFESPLPNTNDVAVLYYDGDYNYIQYILANHVSFTVPNNCCYITFYVGSEYGTTYKNDMALHLTWDESRTGYEPYHSETYALPNIELRSNPNTGTYDEIRPDGTYIQRVDIRAYQSGDESDSSLFTDKTNTIYDLPTPIETQDDDYKYQEVQDIDDFGTQEFLYDSNIVILVPQGNEFFYPVDYKAFIDSLGGREDIEYSADNFVSQTQLANYLKTISGYDATKTQTLKNVNGTFTWVDDE